MSPFPSLWTPPSRHLLPLSLPSLSSPQLPHATSTFLLWTSPICFLVLTLPLHISAGLRSSNSPSQDPENSPWSNPQENLLPSSPRPVWLHHSPGKWRPLYNELRTSNLIQGSFSRNSGGLQWIGTRGSSMEPVSSVPATRLPTNPAPVFSLCPSQADPGHTLLWILLQQPRRQRTYSLLRCSVAMGFLQTVSYWRPQFTSEVRRTFCPALGAKVSLTSVFHPQSNGQSERWRLCYAVSLPTVQPVGVTTYPGLSMHITPSQIHPQACPHSSILWVISLPCSNPKSKTWLFLQSKPSSGNVRGFGSKPVHPSFMPL